MSCKCHETVLKCEKCGEEMKESEVYETNGMKVCEDCSMKLNSYNSPKKNCARAKSCAAA